MLKNNKITITIDDREVEIELTKEQIEKLTNKKSKVWKPKKGDYYYTMSPTYDVVDTCKWNNDKIDENNLLLGNVFNTREEIEFMVEKLKVIKELKDYIIENSEPIDFIDPKIPKYFIECVIPENRIVIECCYAWLNQGTIYCSDVEVLEEAIDVIGEDRIRKYLFDVEEH